MFTLPHLSTLTAAAGACAVSVAILPAGMGMAHADARPIAPTTYRYAPDSSDDLLVRGGPGVAVRSVANLRSVRYQAGEEHTPDVVVTLKLSDVNPRIAGGYGVGIRSHDAAGQLVEVTRVVADLPGGTGRAGRPRVTVSTASIRGDYERRDSCPRARVTLSRARDTVTFAVPKTCLPATAVKVAARTWTWAVQSNTLAADDNTSGGYFWVR